VARFAVEHGTPLHHPERWEPVKGVQKSEHRSRRKGRGKGHPPAKRREAEASGEHAARDAIYEVAHDGEAGWYRARLAGDPEAPWTYCDVRLHPDTGETLLRCLDELPF
jgi:hypothetical protein